MVMDTELLASLLLEVAVPLFAPSLMEQVEVTLTTYLLLSPILELLAVSGPSGASVEGVSVVGSEVVRSELEMARDRVRARVLVRVPVVVLVVVRVVTRVPSLLSVARVLATEARVRRRRVSVLLPVVRSARRVVESLFLTWPSLVSVLAPECRMVPRHRQAAKKLVKSLEESRRSMSFGAFRRTPHSESSDRLVCLCRLGSLVPILLTPVRDLLTPVRSLSIPVSVLLQVRAVALISPRSLLVAVVQVSVGVSVSEYRSVAVRLVMTAVCVPVRVS